MIPCRNGPQTQRNQHKLHTAKPQPEADPKGRHLENNARHMEKSRKKKQNINTVWSVGQDMSAVRDFF